MVQEKMVVDGKVLKLLVERSSLITECDSLTSVVKKFEMQVAELQQGLVEKEYLVKTIEEERNRARSELEDVKQELVGIQG